MAFLMFRGSSNVFLLPVQPSLLQARLGYLSFPSYSYSKETMQCSVHMHWRRPYSQYQRTQQWTVPRGTFQGKYESHGVKSIDTRFSLILGLFLSPILVSKVWCCLRKMGAHDSVVGRGTVLQAGRSWVQFLMRSLDCPHYGPGVDSVSYRNEYHESSCGGNGWPGRKGDNLTAISERTV
jgi:hypothetical protein